jgi:siroheme synthase
MDPNQLVDIRHRLTDQNVRVKTEAAVKHAQATIHQRLVKDKVGQLNGLKNNPRGFLKYAKT